MNTLNNCEEIILRYIVSFKSCNHFSPSLKEIAEGTNYSNIHVRRTLVSLQDKGFISCKPRKARTIDVLKFV